MTGSATHDSESAKLSRCQAAEQLRPSVPTSPDVRHTGRMDPYWVIGKLKTARGEVPVVDTKLRFADKLGSWKARWGIRRMSFRVEPGLYAAGRPTERSPVFVTANYKMSFDRLRSQLGEIDSWVLVLDTKGINVWCAAGKGTFGTDEILRQVDAVQLKQLIKHHRLILPQLGAPGVRAHVVKERSGFRVVYGPVRARDIPAFMQAGRRATAEMRRVTFTFRERIVLIPADLVGSAKFALMAAACFLLLSGFGPGIYSLDRVTGHGVINGALAVIAAAAGATLPAALLPYLPGRAFSVKGAWAGVLPMAGVALIAWQYPQAFHSWLSVAGWLCLIPTVTSFMGMNFTGSSPYTSLSGVKKEMRVALPVQIAATVLGVGLWIVGLFL